MRVIKIESEHVRKIERKGRNRTARIEARGKMSIEDNKPMQADTIFRIASMTKAFTSVAAMMLYEEGHFLLTDPMSNVISEFKELKVLVPAPKSYEHASAPRL